MGRKSKFVWEEGDIEIVKKGRTLAGDDLKEKCSRCGIPDFLAIKLIIIDGKLVCEACITKTEERKILRQRYKKLGLDDSELKERKR